MVDGGERSAPGASDIRASLGEMRGESGERQEEPTSEGSIFRDRAEALVTSEHFRTLMGDAVKQHVEDLQGANEMPADEWTVGGGRNDITSHMRKLGVVMRAANSGFKDYRVGYVSDRGGAIVLGLAPADRVNEDDPSRLRFPPGEDAVEQIRIVVSRQAPRRLSRSAEDILDQTGFSILMHHQRAARRDGRVEFTNGDGVRMFLGDTGELTSHGTYNAGERLFRSETNSHHDMPEAAQAVRAQIAESFYSGS